MRYSRDRELAYKMVEERGCRIDVIHTRPHYPNHGIEIEVFAPDGYTFDGDIHSMICNGWRDVVERLNESRIEKCHFENCEVCGEVSKC